MTRAAFPTTIHLFFFRGDEILLLRRFNTGFRDGEYSVPAGHLDGGETVLQAGVREAKEEAGVSVKTADLTFSSVMHRMDGEERVDFFVKVEGWQGDIFNAEPERCDDLRWFTVNELPDNTIPYIRRAIANHMNRVRFDEFGWRPVGTLLLEGGAEFGGRMRDADLRAIELAGGFDAPLRILPTAAAPDDNHRRAGSNGVRWFEGLGAKDVISVPLIDNASANDEAITQSLREAKLIYMLGGFTHYLGVTLKDSLAWQAALDAFQNGAVIAGSSAGAMVMCEFYFDPDAGEIREGLNLVPNSLVLPHHNRFGKGWAPRLLKEIPNVTLIGIDEQTGMVNDGENDMWSVYGAGEVTLYRAGQVETYKTEKSFSLMSF